MISLLLYLILGVIIVGAILGLLAIGILDDDLDGY
jgi:hypothetical protein